MKKQFFSRAALRFLLTATAFSAAVQVSSAAAKGSPVKGSGQVSISTSSDSLRLSQPLITYMGADEEYYFFRIQILNPDSIKQEIILRDKSSGTVLYKDVFSSSLFVKRIAIPRDLTELQWDLNARNGRGKASPSSYSLITEVKLREDVFVTRL
ncbi:hypothetical protein ACFSQD_00170 [Flavihumibacter stibioxidans]|uniref:Uncharacterized protein n=1 Tax=Flavihumibacter stibioxidans TaxID=1834163 RepID=A0ABR7MD05_9BACT|nr:hypothetical protein [Flavihumibacter stibioxidans]MBC6492915.1 hypothetical protein [Flavihumibacter stibioxidans]